MKKLLTAILSSIAVIALCMCLTACSTSFTGTWKFAELYMNYGGVEQTVQAGKEYNGATISADAIVLEIKEDNTYELKGSMAELIGGTQTGTWVEEEGKYYLVEDDERQEIKLDGTTLVLEGGETGISITVKFKK